MLPIPKAPGGSTNVVQLGGDTFSHLPGVPVAGGRLIIPPAPATPPPPTPPPPRPLAPPALADPPDIEPPEPEAAIGAPPCPPAPPALADPPADVAPPADVLPPADLPPAGELSPAAEPVGSPPLSTPAPPSPAAEQPTAEHKSTHASAGTAQQLRFLISIVVACRAEQNFSFLMLFSFLFTQLAAGVRDTPALGGNTRRALERGA